MILPMVGGFLSALVLSFGLTLGLRPVARRLRMVDRPDGGRKAHARPKPTVGWVGIFLSAALILGTDGFLGASAPAGTAPELGSIEALVVGAALIFLVGVVDDIRGLGPWTRLAAQLVVAGELVLAGARIDRFGPPGQGFVVPAEVGILRTAIVEELRSTSLRSPGGVGGGPAGAAAGGGVRVHTAGPPEPSLDRETAESEGGAHRYGRAASL